MLYEKRVEHIGKGSPVEAHFDDELSFERMFDVLYPPCELGESHGLGIHWEIQLLHPDFVDHELIGDSRPFAREEFFTAGRRA